MNGNRPLPGDDPLRLTLHNEVHARPPARIRLPAVLIYVAVLHEGISRAQELEHLRHLPGQARLGPEQLGGNFLQLKLEGGSLTWERHAEFTRYSLLQTPLEHIEPGPTGLDEIEPILADGWWQRIPGRTFAALKLLLLEHGYSDSASAFADARRWFGQQSVTASLMGHGHSVVVTDFRVRDSGYEHLVVLAERGSPRQRIGRVSQRLLEVETYRLMALRGLPVAKALSPTLARLEAGLADITARLASRSASEAELLDDLISLATKVEHLTAEHQYRFTATAAYEAIVLRRIAELHEDKLPGEQTLGEFMQRRLSPAIATVAATAQRLAALSQRIERASALLRTRVDIATEAQSQQLLTQLGEGQQTQLRMQATVEGLSLAAITYYVVSLLLYLLKALKAEGWLPVSPELAAGLSIPAVLVGVWWTTRRIHRRFLGH